MNKRDHSSCTAVALTLRDPSEVSVNWKALGGFAIGGVCSVGRKALADVLLCLGCWVDCCRYQLYVNV